MDGGESSDTSFKEIRVDEHVLAPSLIFFIL
jgi:hypothetical protein